MSVSLVGILSGPPTCPLLWVALWRGEDLRDASSHQLMLGTTAHKKEILPRTVWGSSDTILSHLSPGMTNPGWHTDSLCCMAVWPNLTQSLCPGMWTARKLMLGPYSIETLWTKRLEGDSLRIALQGKNEWMDPPQQLQWKSPPSF
jgi:hypothetical protein